MLYTVLLLATDPFVRAELSTFLSAHDVVVAAEFAAGEDFSEFLIEVDAVIWDVDEGEVLLPEAVQADAPLLALVRRSEDAARALQYGAVGIMDRTVSGERLLAALGALVQGLAVLEPAFLSGAHIDEDTFASEPLTPRERDVLGLLAEGMSNKAIARQLDVSDHTVKFHLAAVLSKLGARSRTEAVTRAVRAGLLTL